MVLRSKIDPYTPNQRYLKDIDHENEWNSWNLLI